MPPRTKRITALAVVPQPPEPSQLFRDLDVVALAPHPLNVRADVGDVTELAASIAVHGVMEPLLVVPHVGDVADWPDGATHLVVAGHRRLAAAQLAAVATVPCMIRPDLAGDVDAIVAMLTENLQRCDLTPIEEAAGYHQLELRGLGTAAIATRTGRSRTTVEHRLQLLDLPESARTKLTHREITLDQAQALVEFIGDKAALKRLEAAAGTTNWKWELQSLQQARERKKAAAAALARLQAAGVRVVVKADLPTEQWRLALQKVMADRHHPGPTDQEIADHAGCPGHAALTPTSAEVDWVCLQPDLHTSTRPPADEVDVPEELEGDERAEWIAARDAELQAEEEQRAAAQAEVEATREACRIAAAVRSEWLRGLTTVRTKLPAKLAGPIALHLAVTMVRVLLEPDMTDWLSWLGIDVEDLDDDVDEEQMLREAALARDPHRVLLAMLAVEEEIQAGRPHNWAAGRAAPELLPWLYLLVALGYQPSTWELERMEAAKALATRSCRVCGCTNDRACRGGCTWVEPDLCSFCAGVAPDRAPAAGVETVDVVGGVL